jgi:hypothetical protein
VPGAAAARQITGTVPASCRARSGADGAPLPDPACTPGAVTPAVTESNIETTICSARYVAAVQPPRREANAVKRRLMRAYGDRQPSRAYELDHLVPLDLGGTNAVHNLWPELNEPIPQARNAKDLVERSLHEAVCGHRVTLTAAQRAITADWTTALSRLHLPPVMVGRTA